MSEQSDAYPEGVIVIQADGDPMLLVRDVLGGRTLFSVRAGGAVEFEGSANEAARAFREAMNLLAAGQQAAFPFPLGVDSGMADEQYPTAADVATLRSISGYFGGRAYPKGIVEDLTQIADRLDRALARERITLDTEPLPATK